jgi:hypothetical protein
MLGKYFIVSFSRTVSYYEKKKKKKKKARPCSLQVIPLRLVFVKTKQTKSSVNAVSKHRKSDGEVSKHP